jgi:hypothetical protein
LRAHTSGSGTGGSTFHVHKWYDYEETNTSGTFTIDTTDASRRGYSYTSSGNTLKNITGGELKDDYWTNDAEHLPPYLNVIMWRRIT